MSRIPVTIVTGFLGSGKTTLLNRMLHDPSAGGTMVIVNELGEIGLDHQLIEHSDDSVILLTNGCLCCAVKGDLVRTLRDLCFRPHGNYDRVLIETTGLADPCSVIQIILADPVVGSRYTLASVVTTVDAVNGLATLAAHPESLRQAAVADRIVLTKLDLRPQGEAELRARLVALNPSAVLALPEECALAGLVAATPSFVFETPAVAHPHDIRSFSVVRDRPISRATLDLLLRAIADNLGPNLLRVKGLLNIAGEPDKPAVLHGVQSVLHDLAWLERWPSEDRRSRLVFITLGAGRQVIDEVVEAIEQMAARTERRRAADITR
jgi:G3E family GTPase